MLQALYGKEKETVQNFNKINEQLRISATKADTFSAFIFPSMNFINNLGMGLVIGTGSRYGIKRYDNGRCHCGVY